MPLKNVRIIQFFTIHQAFFYGNTLFCPDDYKISSFLYLKPLLFLDNLIDEHYHKQRVLALSGLCGIIYIYKVRLRWQNDHFLSTTLFSAYSLKMLEK